MPRFSTIGNNAGGNGGEFAGRRGTRYSVAKKTDTNMVRILAERRARQLEPVTLPKGSVPREGLEPIP